MSDRTPLTVLCLASYEKGAEFMRQCKREGCRVLLVTVEKLAEASWPRDSIDDVFYMPSISKRDDIINGISYLARKQRIDRIVALDDYDVETAALLREHLRVPGMGDTTARHFRDKLAMRVKALEAGILVPEFVHVLNYDAIEEYMNRVPPPWVLKPRSEASAVGIKKVHHARDLWPLLDALGDRQSFYLLEAYVPGDVYHVDSIVSEGKVVFALSHGYGHPPMNVAHDGGIFTTRTLLRNSMEAQALESLNRELLETLRFVRGVSHTEFIQAREDGRFYFLETSARVGGANIAELVEAASGINLWTEWAKIEIGRGERDYTLPEHREDYAGLILSLARQERPDMSAYDDPEVVWLLEKRYHAGLIVKASEPGRIERLLDVYAGRFYDDFFTSLALPERPTN